MHSRPRVPASDTVPDLADRVELPGSDPRITRMRPEFLSPAYSSQEPANPPAMKIEVFRPWADETFDQLPSMESGMSENVTAGTKCTAARSRFSMPVTLTWTVVSAKPKENTASPCRRIRLAFTAPIMRLHHLAPICGTRSLRFLHAPVRMLPSKVSVVKTRELQRVPFGFLARNHGLRVSDLRNGLGIHLNRQTGRSLSASRKTGAASRSRFSQFVIKVSALDLISTRHHCQAGTNVHLRQPEGPGATSG